MVKARCHLLLVKSKTKFNVQMELLPTGVHLTVLDRKARTIKDHLRGTQAASLFVVGGLILVALYIQITTICNLCVYCVFIEGFTYSGVVVCVRQKIVEGALAPRMQKIPRVLEATRTRS